MVVDSFACPACGEQIAPGRLSCPQCGTVLAAVARSWRSAPAAPEPAPAIARPAAPSWLDAVTTPGPSDAAAGETWDARSDDGWDDEPSRSEAGEADPPPMPTPVAALLDAGPARWRSAEPEPEPEPGTTDDVEPDAREADMDMDDDPADAPAPVADDPAGAEAPGLTGASDATPEPAELPEMPGPAVTRSLLRPAARANPFLAPSGVPDVLQPVEPPAPGPEPDTAPAWTTAAYVPPAAPVVPAASALAHVAPEPAPARILPRAWDPAAATADRAPAPATSPVDGLTRLRQRIAVPAIDRARIDEAAGVVVLAGAMGAGVAFLLPWSRVVIGSRGAGTYFDTWGLAGAGHLVVFLAVLGALALAAIPNRIDTWLRTGVVGIALGALLLGLAWPYAFGPLGAGVGIVLLVVAACLLLFGGLLSTLVQRHGGTASGV